MKKFLALVVLAMCAAGCDNIGSSKIKNLIDLTPKLEVEAPGSKFFSSGMKHEFSGKNLKLYKLSSSGLIAEPALDNGILYSLNKSGNITAFSMDTRKILWTRSIAGTELDKRFHDGGILVGNGKIYVTYGTRYLVILDSASGDELIRKEFPDILRTKPVLATNNLLVVQTISNQVIAYDVESSKMVWIHEGGLETISSRNHIDPIIHNGAVLVSYSSGEVVYLNVNTGSELWLYALTDTTGEIGAPSLQPSVIVTKPVIKKNFVYFATSNGKIVKLDLGDGMEVWSKSAEDIQSMVEHDNNLIVTNNARQIAILSITDGKIRWVGSLLSAKEMASRKPQPVSFLNPFVMETEAGSVLSVIDDKGQLYKFTSDETGQLQTIPTVVGIAKNIRYYFTPVDNKGFVIVTDNYVMF